MPPARALALLVVMLAAGLVAAPARAARPVDGPGEVSPSERLHAKAAEAYKAGHLEEAIELWREAYQLGPSWKYAYNLANVLYEARQPEEAWTFVRMTQELSIPSQYLAQLAELRAKIRAQLLTDHALVALEVTPSDAEVLLDDKPWPAPRETWTLSEASRLDVRRDGYATFSEDWSHPVGKRSEKRVALVALPVPGRLTIVGTPAGALVSVDGDPVGELPTVGPISLKAGDHVVKVALEGWVARSQKVSITRDSDLQVDIALVELPPKKPPERDTTLATAGWITIGAGAVVAGIGVGFLVAANDTGDELEALNTPESVQSFPDYRAYRAAFDAKRETFDDQRTVSGVLRIVGALALATGLTFEIIDLTRDDPKAPAAAPGAPAGPTAPEGSGAWYVAPLVAPGIAGLGLGGSF